MIAALLDTPHLFAAVFALIVILSGVRAGRGLNARDQRTIEARKSRKGK